MRMFIIDTLSTVVFFTIAATFSELIIAGMAPVEVLSTRLVMVPIMIVTGRVGGTGFIVGYERTGALVPY